MIERRNQVAKNIGGFSSLHLKFWAVAESGNIRWTRYVKWSATKIVKLFSAIKLVNKTLAFDILSSFWNIYVTLRLICTVPANFSWRSDFLGCLKSCLPPCPNLRSREQMMQNAWWTELPLTQGKSVTHVVLNLAKRLSLSETALIHVFFFWHISQVTKYYSFYTI